MEYTVQYVQDLIGTATSPETLTAAYADTRSAIFPIGGMHSIVLYLKYIPDSYETNATLFMQVELGPEENDLYYMTKQTDSTVDSLIERFEYEEKFVGATGGTTYKERFSLGDIADRYFRVSFREAVSLVSGTLYVKMVYSGK